MTTWIVLTALALTGLAVAAWILRHRLAQALRPAAPPTDRARHRRADDHDPAATATSVIRRIDPRMLPDQPRTRGDR